MRRRRGARKSRAARMSAEQKSGLPPFWLACQKSGRSLVEFMTSNAASMVQQAGIVALRDGESFVADLRAAYAARRRQALASLATIPGLTPVRPDGAFYVFLKVDDMDGSIVFAERLVREGGLALTPGLAFGPHGEGYVRLCFASSEGVISDAIERLTRFMTAHVNG